MLIWKKKEKKEPAPKVTGTLKLQRLNYFPKVTQFSDGLVFSHFMHRFKVQNLDYKDWSLKFLSIISLRKPL